MRLKELRNKKKMTLKELSNAVGLSPQVLSRYELGQTQPDFSTLIKLAKFFGVSADYLIGIDVENLIERPPYEITDKQTLDIMKLCKVMTEIQKAQVFGYVVALLEQAGVNVQAALNG